MMCADNHVPFPTVNTISASSDALLLLAKRGSSAVTSIAIYLKKNDGIVSCFYLSFMPLLRAIE